MPVKINASSSSGLVVDSDLTGSLQLQTGGNPAISIDSSQVVNFTKQFQIGGVLPPAFSAYKSSQQNFSASTWTKVTLDLEMFDTNNNFASSTFTPTVAGYYQINAGVALSNVTAYPTSGVTGVYKNGLLYLRGLVNFGGGTGAFNDVLCNASAVIYMNGTSDYLELYAYQVAGGTPQIVGNSDTYQTHFSGVLVRAA
jgi:hypothetical protein